MRRKRLIHSSGIKSGLLAITMLLFLTGGIYAIGWSGIFAIKTISCKVEREKECSAEITAELNRYTGNNLLLIRKSEIETRLTTADRLIETIGVNLKLPSSLVVEIVTRKPIAAITSSLSFAEAVTVDSEGVILGKTDDPTGLPRLVWSGISGWPIEERLPDNIVRAMTLGSLAGERFRLEGFISIDSGSSAGMTAVMRLASGEKVWLALDKEPVELLTRLQVVLNQVRIGGNQVSEIDLRFDNPVVR